MVTSRASLNGHSVFSGMGGGQEKPSPFVAFKGVRPVDPSRMYATVYTNGAPPATASTFLEPDSGERTIMPPGVFQEEPRIVAIKNVPSLDRPAPLFMPEERVVLRGGMRVAVPGSMIGFRPARAVQYDPAIDDQFYATNMRPLPGSFPADIRPTTEPHPSAEGFGQEWVTKLTAAVEKAAPKVAEAVARARALRAAQKGAAPAPAPSLMPVQQEQAPGMSTGMMVLIAGGGLLVVGLAAYLLMRK